MTSKFLITGGAGFIGSYIVEKLLNKGNEVVIYDKLVEENYGDHPKIPIYLPLENKDLKFIRADINEKTKLENAIKEADVLIHLASKLGIGKSMYQIEDFIRDNTLGTATLLDILINKEHSVKKLIIASSNSIYGEGFVECENCGIFKPQMRMKNQLQKKQWNIICPKCGGTTKPVPTPENSKLDCTSIYAYSKLHQEQLSMFIGKTYGINTTALRLFNVIGPRQSLSNPYTGVCAIFVTSLLCGNPPTVYEDGLQTRDFINVNDIAEAFILVIENPNSRNEIFNVGTGHPTTVLKLAETLSELINPQIKPKILQLGRVGDVRNCIANISKIKNKLGFTPKYNFDDSIRQVLTYIKNLDKKIIRQMNDKTKKALEELIEKKVV
ncbi:MAG: NAD-dependent epimerase/dehydratase family protein [Promethearchaeota archaeon]